MKMLEIGSTTLDGCVASAQSERIVITRNGDPVALVVGLQGLDEEQIQLGASPAFWTTIRNRRQEPTLSRAALEQRLNESDESE